MLECELSERCVYRSRFHYEGCPTSEVGFHNMAMGTLPPVHPGEVLREEFMKPLGLTQRQVAEDLHVPVSRIRRVVQGRGRLSADTALRLARYFDTSAAVWLRLQVRHDLEAAEASLARRINREVKVLKQPRASIKPAR